MCYNKYDNSKYSIKIEKFVVKYIKMNMFKI